MTDAAALSGCVGEASSGCGPACNYALTFRELDMGYVNLRDSTAETER